MAVSLPETFLFTFNEDASTGTFPPIIEACSQMNFTFETIPNIEESPFAPYYVQFYVQVPETPPYTFLGGSFSSTEGGTLDLPFHNSHVGTQFVTCMYTSNGQTGGCQNLYTVVESNKNCTVDPVPAVENSLSVSMQSPSSTGNLQDLGLYSSWPTGCTKIHFKAEGGLPPYRLTVANAYIPPRNYTFDSDSFEWQVDLSRGYPFFLSILDSAGLSYSAGPLHVGGGGGSTTCLSPPVSSKGMGVFAGVALGGALVGSLIAAVVLLFLRRWTKKNPKPLFTDVDETDFVPTPFNNSHLDRSSVGGPNARLMGSEEGEGRSPQSPAGRSETRGSPEARNVFVLHHDGGGPPVTVFTDGASQVFELPPSYAKPRLAPPNASPPIQHPTFSSPSTLPRASSSYPRQTSSLPPLQIVGSDGPSPRPPSSSPATAVDASQLSHGPSSSPNSNRALPSLPPQTTYNPSPNPTSPIVQLSRGGPTFSSNGRGRIGGPRPLGGGRRWSDSSAVEG
ncbi:hypothetical protein BDY24DRAFT_392033 [Mrakia frigida]|uniref:uncharacterized protein n=1 Tax=Mrakia frigida TaxID=29902 RepID=UPI003FCC209E